MAPDTGGGTGGGSIKPDVLGKDYVVKLWDETHKEITQEKKALMQEFVNQVSDLNVYVGMSSATLGKILQEGRFKTAHETSKSNGYFDAVERRNFESNYFEDSPIYGYLSMSGQATSVTMSYPNRGKPFLADDISGYGNVRVKLKDSVKERTSFVYSDSWDSNKSILEKQPGVLFLASPLKKPSYKSVPSHWEDENYKKPSTDDRLNYWEAQVHGSVSSKDIDTVVFYGKDPDSGLKKELSRAGITWERRDFIETISE
jgi:hypothetical protein